MNKTQKFIATWYGHNFQSSCSVTPEFAKFAREFKAAIKSQLGPGDELVAFNRGHFYCSGFIQRGEQFVYFMTSDVRHFRNGWSDSVVIRTAEHAKDYRGGRNQRAEFENIGTIADQIFTGESFVIQ